MSEYTMIMVVVVIMGIMILTLAHHVLRLWARFNQYRYQTELTLDELRSDINGIMTGLIPMIERAQLEDE